jgi:hypothetical protein
MGITGRKTLGEEDSIPHGREVMMRGGSCDGSRKVMECDVATGFDNPPSTEWTWYPDKVTFGVTGIT